MNPDKLRDLLESVRRGRVSTDDAFQRLRQLPFEDLGFAKVDHHRALRTGFPEVIFGPGKTAKQIIEIARRVSRSDQNVLITRVDPDQARAVRKVLRKAVYSEAARALT